MVVTLPRLRERQIGRQAGIVRQQFAHGNVLLAPKAGQ